MLTNVDNVNSESEIDVRIVDDTNSGFSNVVSGVVNTIKTMFEPDDRMADKDDDSDSENVLAGTVPTLIDEPVTDIKTEPNLDSIDAINNDINPGIDDMQMEPVIEPVIEPVTGPITNAQAQPEPVPLMKMTGGMVEIEQSLKGSLDDPNSLIFKQKHEMYKRIYHALKASVN